MVQCYNYSAFGKEWYKDNSQAFDVSNRYTSQILDEEIGLYYYGARYYDQELGRFIQADSIVPDEEMSQAFNRYSYVINNPLKFVDPTGQFFSLIAAAFNAIVGFLAANAGTILLAGAISAGISAAMGGDPLKGFISGAIGGAFGVIDPFFGAVAGGALGAVATGGDPLMGAISAGIAYAVVACFKNLPIPGRTGPTQRSGVWLKDSNDEWYYQELELTTLASTEPMGFPDDPVMNMLASTEDLPSSLTVADIYGKVPRHGTWYWQPTGKWIGMSDVINPNALENAALAEDLAKKIGHITGKLPGGAPKKLMNQYWKAMTKHINNIQGLRNISRAPFRAYIQVEKIAFKTKGFWFWKKQVEVQTGEFLWMEVKHIRGYDSFIGGYHTARQALEAGAIGDAFYPNRPPDHILSSR